MTGMWRGEVFAISDCLVGPVIRGYHERSLLGSVQGPNHILVCDKQLQITIINNKNNNIINPLLPDDAWRHHPVNSG